MAALQPAKNITTFGALLMELPPQVVFIRDLRMDVDDEWGECRSAHGREYIPPLLICRNTIANIEINCDVDSGRKIVNYYSGSYMPKLAFPEELILNVQDGAHTVNTINLQRSFIENVKDFSSLVYHIMKELGWRYKDRPKADLIKAAKAAAAQAHIFKRRVKIF
jgi:hypothetical protein